MEFVKRHWWLVVTLAAMVVLAGLAVALWIVFDRQMASRQTVLKKSMSALGPSTGYYNSDAVTLVEAAMTYRQTQLDELVAFSKQPQQWQPLIPGIFPRYQQVTQVLNFKLAYQAKLREFMSSLGATDPSKASILTLPDATMYATERSFHKDTWVDDMAVPTDQEQVIRHLCERQDDLWLMEDIVRAIRQTNDAYFEAQGLAPAQRKIAAAVIKEWRRLEIGAQYTDGAYGGGARERRYRLVSPGTSSYSATGTIGTVAEEPEVQARAPTLTGRASNNNNRTYKVLPFRLAVVADAGNYLELVRRLSGTRSFLTVTDVRYEIVPETENAYRQHGLMHPNLSLADRVQVYGERALASVTITGESLIFQTPGARPTVLPKKQEGTGGPRV